MSISVKDGAAWSEADPYVKVSGTWTVAQEVWNKEAGVWEQSYVNFSASVAPSSISEFPISTGVYQTTASAVVTITASGTYTVLWSRISGDTEITPVTDTATSTKFTANIGISDDFTTGFQCVVKEGAVTLATISLPSVRIRHTP